MKRNKIIYLCSSLIFLALLLGMFLTGISLKALGGIHFIFLPVLIINFLIFLFIIFKSDFSKSGNYISSVFNWITICFLLLGYNAVNSINPGEPEGGGFGLGFFLIFFVWPALGISNLISWISSIVFYFKNRIVLSEKDKTNIKRFGKIKWTLIFGIILSAIFIPSYVIYETYFHYWTNKVTSEINYYGYNFSSLVFILIFSFVLGFIITLLLNNIKDIVYIRKNNFT